MRVGCVLLVVLAFLASVTRSNAQTALSGEDTVTLSRIDLVHDRDDNLATRELASVFDRTTLADLIAPYENRPVTVEDLFALKNEITQRYTDAGFVNSGAVVEDQDISDGVLEILIVEGQLGAIDVTGSNWLDAEYVGERLRRSAGSPLNVEGLRDRVQLLLNDPMIEQLNVELEPTEVRGVARLDVDIVEKPVFTLGTSLTNDQSPSTGGERLGFIAAWRSLTGVSDPLILDVGFTRGAQDGQVFYERPLTANDLRGRIVLDGTDTEVVEDDFEDLKLESRSAGIQIGLNQPVYRPLSDKVDLDLVLERRRGESFFAEEGFSFAPGTKNGVSDVTALRFAQTWVRQKENLAFALRSLFSLGLDMLGSTINSHGIPDSQFLTWQGQGEAVLLPFAQKSLLPVALLEEQQIVMRAGAQLTGDSLLPSEQHAVGGVNTVRGYRQNEIVRDIGWFVQLEYRVPIAHLPVRALGAGIDDGRVDIFPFFDAGGGFNNSVDATDQDGNQVIITKDKENIASVGLGLRWEPAPALEMALSVGVPFTQGYPDEQDDLQDYGINFLLRFELWPWPLKTRSSMNG